jgi:hypothetical protein
MVVVVLNYIGVCIIMHVKEILSQKRERWGHVSTRLWNFIISISNWDNMIPPHFWVAFHFPFFFAQPTL